MIVPCELRLVDRIRERPEILGLGDLRIRNSSWRVGQVSLLLEDAPAAILHVVELQLGPTDDRQVIRLVERWAAQRQRDTSRRCFAALGAWVVEARYRRILTLIQKAIPVVAMEIWQSDEEEDTVPRFTPLRLG